MMTNAYRLFQICCAAVSTKLFVVRRQRHRRIRTFGLGRASVVFVAHPVDGRLDSQQIFQNSRTDFGRRLWQNDESAVVDRGDGVGQLDRRLLLLQIALASNHHHLQIPSILTKNGTQNISDQLCGFGFDADWLFGRKLEPEEDPGFDPDLGAGQGGAFVGQVERFFCVVGGEDVEGSELEGALFKESSHHRSDRFAASSLNDCRGLKSRTWRSILYLIVTLSSKLFITLNNNRTTKVNWQ